MKTARSVAVDVIYSIISNGSYSNIAADSAVSTANLNRLDSGLATALIYGCLQRKLTFDVLISRLNSSRKTKTDNFVLSCLYVGLYQLLYMDKIPQSAAVDETVKVLKKSKFKYAAGFLNAILRKAANQKDEILQEIENSRDISFKYSCPVGLLKRLIKDYGRMSAEAFLEASLSAPLTFARVNTLKVTPDELIEMLEENGIVCSKTDVENCISIKNYGNLSNLSEFNDGLFYIQDTSSQKAIEALLITENMRVLDICAAPGGKTFTAAMHLKNKGKILSCDMYEHRVGLIKNGAKRLSIDCIETKVADATQFDESLGKFDRIICDVPCSGFGVLRRKPEIKYKNDTFEELSDIQLKILSNAARYLENGGLLMYSTCTVRKAENEEIVEKFAQENNDFKICSMKTLMPQTDGTDGFFYCILKRV